MEREDKKQNIIIKGIEKEEGELKESVRNIIKELGVEAEIKNVRKTGGRKEGREEMAVVTLGSWEQKKKVMEKKRLLKGRKERIDDDLTWQERRIRQKLIEIAIGEERKGKRVSVGRGWVRIDGKWWNWVEEEEGLKTREGKDG